MHQLTVANRFSFKGKTKIGPRLLLGAGVVLMLLFPHANIGDPPPDEEPTTVLDAYGIDWNLVMRQNVVAHNSVVSSGRTENIDTPRPDP